MRVALNGAFFLTPWQCFNQAVYEIVRIAKNYPKGAVEWVSGDRVNVKKHMLRVIRIPKGEDFTSCGCRANTDTSVEIIRVQGVWTGWEREKTWDR